MLHVVLIQAQISLNSSAAMCPVTYFSFSNLDFEDLTWRTKRNTMGMILNRRPSLYILNSTSLNPRILDIAALRLND